MLLVLLNGLLLSHHRVLGGQEVFDGFDQVSVAALENEFQDCAALVWVETLEDFQGREAPWAKRCRLC